MTPEAFNSLSQAVATETLATCCGAQRWVADMEGLRPFGSIEFLHTAAIATWYDQCGPKDWLEAFEHHPKIGDLKSLTQKFASTKEWAGQEQQSVNTATRTILEALAAGNTAYEQQFGYIFIVCATGKSAAEMLRLLQDRLSNDPETELRIAMGEQAKITAIRLNKLIEENSAMSKSHITTHVLDTSLGKPGQGISIRLMMPHGDNWKTLAQGITDNDGRIGDLLPPGKLLAPGPYKMVFDTGAYFAATGQRTFYPWVEIQFTVFDDSHYHVPLLLNPFGYSTYRGS